VTGASTPVDGFEGGLDFGLMMAAGAGGVTVGAGWAARGGTGAGARAAVGWFGPGAALAGTGDDAGCTWTGAGAGLGGWGAAGEAGAELGAGGWGAAGEAGAELGAGGAGTALVTGAGSTCTVVPVVGTDTCTGGSEIAGALGTKERDASAVRSVVRQMR
jgi:hypothetical protein